MVRRLYIPAWKPSPLHLREANEFVTRYHRHNMPTVGGKFALGAAQDGRLLGVAIAGRPVCRRLDGKTLEVLRVCTDGTPNTRSFLYARTARIARLMGYERVITYTLASEGGASLRAVGAKPIGPLESHEWGIGVRGAAVHAGPTRLLQRWNNMTPSLCEACALMREVVTPKASRFLLCQLSQTDLAYPNYPPQPVVRCGGYQKAKPEKGNSYGN